MSLLDLDLNALLVGVVLLGLGGLVIIATLAFVVGLVRGHLEEADADDGRR
jgi:hypothetical protein